MAIYVDDIGCSSLDFISHFEFFATQFFPRVAFGPVILSGPKARLFDDTLEIVSHEIKDGAISSIRKHREKFRV